jgi:hypothetical protein
VFVRARAIVVIEVQQSNHVRLETVDAEVEHRLARRRFVGANVILDDDRPPVSQDAKLGQRPRGLRERLA